MKTKPYVISNRTKPAKVISLPNLDNSTLEVKNELGVDNIKAAFKTILEVGEMIIELVKNFSIPAALPVILELAKVSTYIPVFKQALQEFKDVTPAEAEEISRELKINFDLKNDNLEKAIERVIDLIPATYDYLYKAIYEGINLYASWKGAITNLQSLMIKEAA